MSAYVCLSVYPRLGFQVAGFIISLYICDHLCVYRSIPVYVPRWLSLLSLYICEHLCVYKSIPVFAPKWLDVCLSTLSIREHQSV